MNVNVVKKEQLHAFHNYNVDELANGKV